MTEAAFEILGSPVTWLEVAAFVLSLWMVGCNMRVDPLAWPLAIAASALYGVLFAQTRLYGQAGLQVVFIVVSAWGWWQWRRARGSDGGPLVVRPLSTRGRWTALAGVLVAWLAIGLILERATDSAVPWQDALPAAGGLVGQWLLARKHIENWLVWLGVNLVSVALFAGQSLWLTVALYALFAALSIVGWRAWRGLLGQVSASASAPPVRSGGMA